MKALLANHGEKLFFVLVAGLAGWSLYASVTSLGATEHLPASDITAIGKISKELGTTKASPKTVAPYDEMLQANLDGHGIYALAVGTIESPGFYEPPFLGTPPNLDKEVVGKMGPPTGLSATPDRGKVTFGWTASTTANMKVLRYDVHRREEDGAWSAETVYAGQATSFIDKKVKPETVYAYKVRAVGALDASDEDVIVRPAAPPLVKQGEVWITAFVGEAGDTSATTPSNIDFECSNVFEKFGQKYANIVIKRWNSESDDWDRFAAEYEDASGVSASGVAVGEKVVGRRIPRKGEIVTDKSKLEVFDSGYVLKEVKREIVIIKKKVRYKKADGTWGVRIAKVPKVVHLVLLENATTKSVVTIPVGKGKATIRRKKPKDGPAAKPKPADGGIADLRRMFESSTSSSGGEERPGRAGGPAAPAAPATVRLEDARTSVRLTFPAGWAVSADIAADLGVGAAGMTLLDDGKVTAYKGTAAKSGVVVVDKPLNESKKRRLVGRADGKLDAAREALLLAGGLFKMDREILPGIETWGKTMSRNTESGKVIGTYVFLVTEGEAKTAVKRYCGTSPGHLYLLSFVCGEQDFEKLEESFDKIAYGWTW
jgi:hypothetical protein